MNSSDKSQWLPQALRGRARKLGTRIDLVRNVQEPDKELDYGPFMLIDVESGKAIWPTGLPMEGIADALNCWENELSIAQAKACLEAASEAWAEFGKEWLP